MDSALFAICVAVLVRESLQQGSRTFFYSDSNDYNFEVTATHTSIGYVNTGKSKTEPAYLKDVGQEETIGLFPLTDIK